jgi:hypothetical protein
MSNKMTQNKCIIGICSSNSPYDTSIFQNNENVFYTQISYEKLLELESLIDNSSKNITDMNILFIKNSLEDSKVEKIFRFICSSDCSNKTYNEYEFKNKIYRLIKKISNYKNVIFDLADHSMEYIIKDWDDSVMGNKCPIEIENFTISGPFNMIAKKEDLMKSKHISLKKIAELSKDDEININFNNMPSTKVFKIVDKRKVFKISEGNSEIFKFKTPEIFSQKDYNSDEDQNLLDKKLENQNKGKKNKNKNKNNNEDFETPKKKIKRLGAPYPNEVLEKKDIKYPVHCEFKYNKSIFVISSTHWCNINKVDFNVNEDSLRREYTNTFGQESQYEVDNILNLPNNEFKINSISKLVREVSSGRKQK